MSSVRTVGSVLSREIGWSWPLILVKALIKKKALFKRVQWCGVKGAGRFCKREYPVKNFAVCHRVVTKSPFHPFFEQAGTPKLTRFFCKVDQVFYAEAFPELKFHRGGSWENTIGYGKDHCDFIFESIKGV